jgi:hypothetical protein
VDSPSVTPFLVALAALVAVGGIVAVSAREPRFAVLGVIIALVAAGYVADPLPGLVALAARLAGAVLAGYLVWVALRKAPAPTAGWHVGWPGATALAVVAFAAGWLAAGSLAAALGATVVEGPSTSGVAPALVAGSPVPRAALAAAFALVALGAAPVLVARDVLRLGMGLLLLVAAAGLVRNALLPGGDPGVELAFGIFEALSGAAVAALVATSIHLHFDLELRGPRARQPAIHHRSTDEAHPRRPEPGDER